MRLLFHDLDLSEDEDGDETFRRNVDEIEARDEAQTLVVEPTGSPGYILLVQKPQQGDCSLYGPIEHPRFWRSY